jgi:hypothetical protein
MIPPKGRIKLRPLACSGLAAYDGDSPPDQQPSLTGDGLETDRLWIRATKNPLPLKNGKHDDFIYL